MAIILNVNKSNIKIIYINKKDLIILIKSLISNGAVVECSFNYYKIRLINQSLEYIILNNNYFVNPYY